MHEQLRMWLEDRGCYDVVPINVVMNTPRIHNEWTACIYNQDEYAPEGSEAWRRGNQRYTRIGIYCLGELPNRYWREKICFRLPGDARVWFVAGYYQHIKPEFQEFHPFGAHFILMPWTSSLEDLTSTHEVYKLTLKEVN